ncbi:MAG TPA: hypothetical protein VK604_08110 [Bryobacteraceae bacterium]|nr:hypothetical protein [Bryobacteraceae bacterium]
MKTILALASLALPFAVLNGAELPEAAITNGQIQAKIYLPDGKSGFYRGTRFDWSGVIYSLRFQDHDYYGPWFTKTGASIHDFVYEGPDIIAGPCSAITGPVDEFGPLGWEEAKPGDTFIKIGIGALRKPDNGAYDNYHLYDVADPGKWDIRKKRDSIEFTQTLKVSPSGFGYVYRKTVQLADGKPEMVLRHSIKNTGSRAIQTSVYNHNFLVLDRQPPGPGVAITVPFQIESPRPPDKTLAEIRGNQIIYLNALKDRDTVATPLQGFSNSVQDNQIRIENSTVGAGMTIQADRPLLREALWSIRSVLAVEPFIAISIEPGEDFAWTSTYGYYMLPAPKK